MVKKMTEEILTVKENVIKLRNSKYRYLKITENQFNEISHGDIAEVVRKETDNYIDLIYRFKKTKVYDPKKEKIIDSIKSTKKR